MTEYNIDNIKKEFALLRRYAAIQGSIEDKIGVQKIYVDIAGDIHAAFVLDELIFFTLPRPDTGKSGLRVWKNGVLWMAVSRSEWWKRKRLTPKQADGAIDRLLEKELIFKDLFLFNAQKTTHLRLNVAKFFDLYMKAVEESNPPEDESDTDVKDLSDLYEMLGIPKRDTVSPKGDTPSLKGDSYNSPNTSSTQPFNGVPPISEFPIEWQLAAGTSTVTPPDEKESQMKDTANLIAMGTGTRSTLYYSIAYAFMKARQIVLSNSDAKGQRKAIKEMLEYNVQPDHVTAAVQKLVEAGMTFTDLFGVKKTAIALANAVTEAYNPQGLEVGL